MASGLATMKALGRPESGLGGGMLDVRAVKLYADGALGSRGAALLEPYADDPGNSGLLARRPRRCSRRRASRLAHGFQVGTHAIGDRANRMVLDAYEKALRRAAGREGPALPDRARADPRRRGHPALRPARRARLDAGHPLPLRSPLGSEAARRGARRARARYVWRKLLDSGARILNGTDAPVEDVSPIQNFHASVTRAGADGQPPGGFDPDQKLTRDEALRSMTLDAAYGSFAERERGSIEVGKLADLVVLSQDILSVPEDALLKTEVVATIVGGRVLYEKPR